MRALILNGSPKRKSSASKLLGRILGLQLTGVDVSHASLRAESEYPKILQQLREIDLLVIAAPLYVDGIPSHLLVFLQQAERFCRQNGCRFTLYAVSNNGFIEGSHNRTHLKMYECWCRRAGVTWGGGLGVGGGEMFHCLAVYYPLVFAALIAVNLVKYALGSPAAPSDWLPLAENIGIYALFNCGVFYSVARLATGMRKLQKMKNRYTRVMIPAFLFIPMADLFMALSALCNGKNIFRLLKRDPCARGPASGRTGGD